MADEKYFCANCRMVRSLNDHLRCVVCNSDAVVSEESILRAAQNSRLVSEAVLTSLGVTPLGVESSLKINYRIGSPQVQKHLYRVDCGPFYTTLLATSEIDALTRACWDTEHTWQLDSKITDINKMPSLSAQCVNECKPGWLSGGQS